MWVCARVYVSVRERVRVHVWIAKLFEASLDGTVKKRIDLFVFGPDIGGVIDFGDTVFR